MVGWQEGWLDDRMDGWVIGWLDSWLDSWLDGYGRGVVWRVTSQDLAALSLLRLVSRSNNRLVTFLTCEEEPHEAPLHLGSTPRQACPSPCPSVRPSVSWPGLHHHVLGEASLTTFPVLPSLKLPHEVPLLMVYNKGFPLLVPSLPPFS